jgi:DNA helicase-2/ATP-dependent DNA helicase PcrA
MTDGKKRGTRMTDASNHDLEQAFNALNSEQQNAVNALDGPVLVVAGPGTGKTQLLGLRAVNILQSRDVSPRNILCLTFTEAGAEAMTKRLVKFIGRDAYEIAISTFHGFAQRIRSDYPEFFRHGSLSTLITDLQSSRVLNRLLHELHVRDPLAQNIPAGLHGQLGNLKGFISRFKRSGLDVEQFKKIMEQNLAFFDYVSSSAELMGLLGASSGSAEHKRTTLDQLQETLAALTTTAPRELRTPVVATPGIYQTYVEYLADAFLRTELYENEGKSTKGFRDLRDRLFEKENGIYVFKDRKTCDKALSAINIYERYQAYLDNHAQYDYDDMILDAVKAIESSSSLKSRLQDQYHFIQVDEFQDTNGAQMRLIDLLTDNSVRPNILVVGDDDQAIYRFQGASVFYINQFEKKYDAVTRCVLKTNYRSTPSLVELGQVVARQIETRSEASNTEKVLKAAKKEEAPRRFTIHSYPSLELQYHEVAKAIRERIDAGFIQNSEHPDEAIAVIARGHKTLRGLIPYLKAFGIAFNYTYTTTVAKTASLQTLLVLLNFIAEYSKARPAYSEIYLPQILASEELGFDARAYLGLALDAKRLRLNAQKEDMRWLEALKVSDNPSFRTLHSWLMDLIEQATTKPVRQVIFSAAQPFMTYYRNQQDDDPFAYLEFNYGLKALLDFVECELDNPMRGLSDPPLRLPEMIDCFAETKLYGITIDATIPINRSGAITLTTAHASKGLEFSLVYLVDTDDKSWHSKSNSGLLCRNLLFGDTQEEDDARRLLFVAVTRAKDQLEATRGPVGTTRELLDSLDETEVNPDVEDVVAQSERAWQDSYRLDSEELQALVKPDLEHMKMSVSRLNQFVEYQPGCANSTEFIASNMLRLPNLPNYYAAFGTAFHAFIEDYLNHVVVAQDNTVESLVEKTRQKINRLDFERTDIDHMQQRFNHILEKFMPRLSNYLTGPLDVERWIEADLDGIPLVAKCDLMVRDEEVWGIRVFDFKTRQSPPDGISTAYLRQLQFYRMVVESSSDFEGWKVISSTDLYVEPMKSLGYELLEPEYFTTTDAEIEHLKLLIKAVWHRIQNGLFDTSAFENSDYYAAVRPTKFRKDGSLLSADKEPVQSAYEQWLIAEWRLHEH